MPVLLWFGVLQLFGIAATPIVATVLSVAPDRGYGLARTVGWLLVGYLCWLTTSVFHIPGTGAQAWIVLALLLTPLATPWGRRAWQTVSPLHLKTSEWLFFGTTALFLFFRSCQPEIFWGEKPMDFTFLNFFIRLESLPPEDPWAAGHLMQYYYFGTYLIALIHKMTGVDPAVGYNLAIGTLAGLFVSCAYTVLAMITRRRWTSAIGALALLLLADGDAFLQTVTNNGKHGFDLFWASSRVMSASMANEYPLWSLLFADLHAHVIVLPFTLVLIALSLRFFFPSRRWPSPDQAMHLALFALLWGSLVMINSWDFISYGIFSGLLFLVAPLRRGPDLKRRIGFSILRGGEALALALIAIGPFLHRLASSPENRLTLEHSAFFTAGELLRYVGIFAVPATGLVWLLAVRRSFHPRSQAVPARTRGKRRALRPTSPRFSWRRLLLPLLAAELMWLGNLVFKLLGIESFPWSATLVTTIPLVGAVALLQRPALPRRLRIVAFLILSATLLTWLGEFFYLRDRMNSLFKLSSPLWVLYGLAAVGLGRYALFYWRRSPFWRRRRARWPSPAALLTESSIRLGLATVAIVASVGSLVDIEIMTGFQRTRGPRFTLDGLAYLRTEKPEERALVEYVRQHLSGTPRTLEAWGPPYQRFTRFAMYTGLPTFLGWEHHVKQRGLDPVEVATRSQIVEKIYDDTDPDKAYSLLEANRIDLVVVGSLERSTYRRTGLAKFDRSKHFRRMATFGGETLYRVMPDTSSRATAAAAGGDPK